MLSDRDIQRAINLDHLKIYPKPKPSQWQPATVDLRLGAVSHRTGNVIRPLEAGGVWELNPGQFLLGSTEEIVEIGPSMVGQVHGKSTCARLGLIVHAAGLIDPGFTGQLTLEMFNMSQSPIFLHHGMMICQVSFEWLSSTCQRPYGTLDLMSHYQSQRGPTPARHS